MHSNENSNDRMAFKVFAILGGSLLIVPPIIFSIAGNDTAVTVCLTVDAMLVLFGVILGSYAAGARFTRSTMAMGSDLVLRAQESDDRRDIKQMETFGKLMIEGGRIAQRMKPSDAPTALPLESQGMDWLPPVALLEDVEADYG